MTAGHADALTALIEQWRAKAEHHFNGTVSAYEKGGFVASDEEFVRQETYDKCADELAALVARMEPASAKCDGNHAGPRCADPQCWNDAAPDLRAWAKHTDNCESLWPLCSCSGGRKYLEEYSDSDYRCLKCGDVFDKQPCTCGLQAALDPQPATPAATTATRTVNPKDCFNCGGLQNTALILCQRCSGLYTFTREGRMVSRGDPQRSGTH